MTLEERGIRVNDGFVTLVGSAEGIVVTVDNDRGHVTIFWEGIYNTVHERVERGYPIYEVYDTVRQGLWIECEASFL